MAKYLIVGGVAGGATTAARLRRLDEESEIVIFERGEHISYANCGLPYYIGGVITDRSRLLLQTPESFNARFQVDVRIRTEVTHIHPDKKSVIVKNLETGETAEESYDQLILSPGARPVVPPIEGIKSQKIFTLRNVDDTDRIKNFIDAQTPKRAVVVGAGFIGIEMAENLHHRGVETTVVEAGNQILNPLDFEMASVLHDHFKAQNVGLVLDNPVHRFEETAQGLIVHLQNGDQIEADIVMLSIGVRPDVHLAKDAGLNIGKHGGILVDEHLQTSADSIYAVGDGIEFKNAISNEVGLSLLAGPANKQGRLLADNLVLGRKRTWKGSIQTAIAKVFSLTAATTGLNEKTLKRLGKKYHATVISGGSHAGYYPNATPMNLKLTFDDEGVIFGAQIVGGQGVDKRIDMIATMIQSGGTIYDLMEIEHAYAPPFSSAKDPVNQLGFNAENILHGLLQPISYEAMQAANPQEITILDVRTPEEYGLGNINGSINIPVDNVRENLHQIPKDKRVYVYCAVGLRGYVASRILKQKGYDVYNLSGGYKLYAQATAEQSHPIFTKTMNQSKDKQTPVEVTMKTLDCKGLQCPGPILKLKEAVDEMKSGESLRVTASDAGFYKDVESWCHVTGNVLVDRKQENGIIEAILMKGNGEQCPIQSYERGDNKTIICFSDDMDKALAAFVIANGAASMGKKVTIFFTFWGLNVIKRHDKPHVKKDFMGKMFSKMMPSHASKLTLSNMNMGGMGSKMMKIRMAQKNVDMLEQMIAQAVKGGVQLIACQMSMDIMGVDKAEFIEGVQIGGVANYLEEAEQANVNLFV